MAFESNLSAPIVVRFFIFLTKFVGTNIYMDEVCFRWESMYTFRKLTVIVFGSFLIAVGVNFCLVPYELLDGGALGVALIFHYLKDIEVGLAILMVSLPIFALAFCFHRPFFYNGINGMLFSSLIIDFLYPLHILGERYMTVPMVSAVTGGFLVGTGVGLMLVYNTSIGGTDLFAQIIAKHIRANPGKLIFIVDVIVISIGSYLLPASNFLLSFVTVCCVGASSTFIVRHFARL